MIRAEQIICGRQPFVEIFLHHGERDLSRSEDSRQTGVTREHMKKFFFEHCGHTLGQRGKRRMAEHRQLKFTIPVDKLSVRKEIEPVVNRRVERTQQPIAFEGSSLQKFSSLQFSGISKVVN